jgi:non-heme chloroperoxidase
MGQLSSIATRHPERVTGLIYLDAANPYAFYLPDSYSSVEEDVNALRRALTRLPIAQPSEIPMLLREIRAELPKLDKNLHWYGDYAAVAQDSAGPALHTPEQRVSDAMALGALKYTDVKPPILAIFAVPKPCVPSCDDPFRVNANRWLTVHVDAFEKAYPAARIVRLPLANHFVWRSNEADVLREMNSFMDGLH